MFRWKEAALELAAVVGTNLRWEGAVVEGRGESAEAESQLQEHLEEHGETPVDVMAL